jgi:hypothetical protein
LFKDKIVCNERLGGLLKGCFMARMSFLIVLETLILAIPDGILKNAVFPYGLLPVFLAEIYKKAMCLKHCTKIYTNNIQVSHAPHSSAKRCQNGVSRHL